MEPLFSLGHVVATQGVIALDLPLDTIVDLLRRHQTGDWGEIGDEDRRENEVSLRQGFRLMSVYSVNDTKLSHFWQLRNLLPHSELWQ